MTSSSLSSIKCKLMLTLKYTPELGIQTNIKTHKDIK